MGTRLIIPPKYGLNHHPPDPGKQTALKNNLSNRNKASLLRLPTANQIKAPACHSTTPLSVLVMPIPVLSLAPCDLLNSKITLHTVPSCSSPPRGSWASEDTPENGAQLIPCLCTGSACDIPTMVPSSAPPSFILWGQNTLCLLIKEKRQPAHIHVTHSPSKILKTLSNCQL